MLNTTTRNAKRSCTCIRAPINSRKTSSRRSTTASNTSPTRHSATSRPTCSRTRTRLQARQLLQRDSRIGLERLTGRACSAQPGAVMPKPFWAPAGNEGCNMTEPTDIDRDIAATSRRRFLRDGGALVGGAVIAGGLAGAEALGASESAHNQGPGMDEGARRSHGKPALRNAFAVREGSYQEYPKGSVAISIRVRTDAAAGSRRHHHAERIVL